MYTIFLVSNAANGLLKLIASFVAIYKLRNAITASAKHGAGLKTKDNVKKKLYKSMDLNNF